MSVITGILVDVVNNKIEKKVIEYENTHEYLDQINELLDCKTLDCKRVEFAGINTYIYFDDIGKLREQKRKPGVLLVNDTTGEICDVVLGNIWIEKYLGGEDTLSFEDIDIKRILKHCKRTINYKDLVLVSEANWVSFNDIYGDWYE